MLLNLLFPLLVLVVVGGFLYSHRRSRKLPQPSRNNPTKPLSDEDRAYADYYAPRPLELTPTASQVVSAVPSPATALAANDRHDDPQKDSWEIRGEVTGEFQVKAVFRLHYVDGSGLATERTVEVRRCGQYFDDVMIAGHCRLRNAYRSFLVSRIKSCFDEETGEVVANVGTYLKARYEQSPEYALMQLLEREHNALRILLYVAKADGYLRAKEKALIAQYCRDLCSDDRITDAMMDDALGCLEVPSIHVFRRLVTPLKSSPAESRAKLIDTVEKMITTDKKIHPAEQEALDYLRNKWKSED